jgi:hypothetical protein
MTYHIFGNYNDVGDGEEAILLVPLDYEIVKNYTLLDKEKLFARSMHYVFNSRVVTKVKWYQRGLFKAFLFIVAIVVFVFTGLPALINFAAGIAAGTITVSVALMAVATFIAKSLIVSFIAKKFVKAIGGELAIIIALIAAVVGAYKGFQAGGLQGAPWAKDLLALSTNLTKAIGAVLSDQMQGLKQDYLNFSDFMKEANKELDVANKLLDTNNWLSPLILFGETPNEYFQRTVHSGNIGVMSLAAVGGYVENALALPRIEQTIEGIT